MLYGIQNKKDIFLGTVFSCIFLLSFLGSSVQYLEALLFFTLLFLYFFNHKYPINKDYKRIIYSMIGVFIAYCTCFFYSQGFSTELSPLNPYINYFICALIALFLFSLRLDISEKMIFFSIAVAGILNGLFAFYQAFILQMGRVCGMIGIFKFSQTSGTICIILAILAIFGKTKKEKIFYTISCAFSFCVVVLSVTRGSYVGLLLGFFVVLVLLFVYGYIRKALFLIAFLSVCGGLWGVKFIVDVKNTDPLNLGQLQKDLELHQEGVVNTSNGLRIEMWKEAIAVFKISPIFGMHSNLVDKHLDKIIKLSKTKRTFNELLDEKDRNPNPALYPAREKIIKAIAQNRHNQFFDTLSSAGILGLSSLFFMIFSFLFAFLKGCGDEQKRPMFFAGIGVLFFFGGCSIGDVPFSSNFMIPFIMLVCIILLKLGDQKYAL